MVGVERTAIEDIEFTPSLTWRSLQPLNDVEEVKRGTRSGDVGVGDRI
jgi:hypothetical protein